MTRQASFQKSRTQIVWEQLVTGNPQVSMTVKGHEHEGPYREDGEHYQVSVTDAGMSVFEIRVNHQGYVHLLTGNDPYLFDRIRSRRKH